MIQAIRITFGVAWALAVLVARILGVALAIVGWLIGALNLIFRLAVIVLLLILIALLLHFFGGINFAYAQGDGPATPGTGEAQVAQLVAEAQSAQADAAAAQNRAQSALATYQTLQAQASAAQREAEQKQLEASVAEAQVARDRYRDAQALADRAGEQASLAVTEATGAIERSSLELQKAVEASSRMGEISAELQEKIRDLAAAQVALESARAENADLREVLRAERGTTMWLQGALLLVATAAMAALALMSRRRPVTERVIERVLQPQVLIVPAEGGEPVDMTPRDPGLTILNQKFAEQILKRYGAKDNAIYDQPTGLAG